jgi:hypothetical protein
MIHEEADRIDKGVVPHIYVFAPFRDWRMFIS